jgi:hypothetical protein
MARGKRADPGCVVAQARRVYGGSSLGRAEDLRARGREQDRRARDVPLERQRGRVVRQVKAVRHVAAQLANEERVVEPCDEGNCRFDRRCGEAPPAHGHPVKAVVVARSTSTATIAYPSR